MPGDKQATNLTAFAKDVKKKDVGVAFALGPESSIAALCYDKNKRGAALKKLLGTPKTDYNGVVYYGNASLDGKELTIFTDQKAEGFDKKIKTALHKQGATAIQTVIIKQYTPDEVSKALEVQVARIPGVLKVAPTRERDIEALRAQAQEAIGREDMVGAGGFVSELRALLDNPGGSAGDEDTGTETVAESGSPPPAPPPPEVVEQHDAADLLKQLTELVKRIPGVSATTPSLASTLGNLAREANVQIRTGNLKNGALAIQQLALELDGAPTTTKSSLETGADGKGATYAKAGAVWRAVHTKIVSDLDKLRGEISATYPEDGIGADLAQRYDAKIAPLLAGLDDSLADTLNAAGTATDPAARAQHVAEARTIMQGYAKILASEKIIADLDSNPFMKLSIQATVASTLATLSKSVVA